MRTPRDWFGRRRQRYTLVAMRLANMMIGHPDMTTDHRCSRCGAVLGLYPSGQRVLAKYGKRVDLVCHVCHGPPVNGIPAPGAVREMRESRRV